MNTLPLRKEDLDLHHGLNHRPLVDKTHATFNTHTIGDLHAHAMKLLYFLVREGVVDISDIDYQRLNKIYHEEPTAESIDKFNVIVDDLHVNPKKHIRLLGDELAGRGNCDYYVLKLLHHLTKNNVAISTLLSNHGIEFILAYEHFEERSNTFQATLLESYWPSYATYSLGQLEEIRKLGLIDDKHLVDMIEETYKPSLKLIDYHIDTSNTRKSHLTLYSHAAIDLKIVSSSRAN